LNNDAAEVPGKNLLNFGLIALSQTVPAALGHKGNMKKLLAIVSAAIMAGSLAFPICSMAQEETRIERQVANNKTDRVDRDTREQKNDASDTHARNDRNFKNQINDENDRNRRNAQNDQNDKNDRAVRKDKNDRDDKNR